MNCMSISKGFRSTSKVLVIRTRGFEKVRYVDSKTRRHSTYPGSEVFYSGRTVRERREEKLA